jgi:hypothetical protein
MTRKYDINTTTENHKKIAGRKVKITTITRRDKKRIKTDDILMVAESMMKQNPGKRLMIKCMSDIGYFQLKGEDQGLDAILDEEEYFNSKANRSHDHIFKVSFYLTY